MARQNPRTTRKGRGVRAKGVRKKTPIRNIPKKKSVKKLMDKKMETNKTNITMDKNIVEEHTITKIDEEVVEKSTKKSKSTIPSEENVAEGIINEWGQKVKIMNDISTVEGTLYKDEIVKVEATGDGIKDLRVIDNLGRVWYVNLTDISTKV